jgi:hypothetical protein
MKVLLSIGISHRDLRPEKIFIDVNSIIINNNVLLVKNNILIQLLE